MIAFPGMLVPAAEAAGMSVPSNPDEFDSAENGLNFPHFYVFCMLQLGRPILHGMTSHWSNAVVIAAIPEDKIKSVTLQDILDLGFV